MQDVRICPICGNDNIKIIDTRNNDKGLYRRRKCNDCGHVYKTYEVLELEFDTLGELKDLSKLNSILREFYGR